VRSGCILRESQPYSLRSRKEK